MNALAEGYQVAKDSVKYWINDMNDVSCNNLM